MTLVEILVVIVIMGIVGAVVVLSVPPRQSSAERAARSFARAVPAYADLAIAGARPIGMTGGEGVTILTRRSNEWQPSRSEPLPPDVRLSLTPGGEILPPDPPSERTLIVYTPPGQEKAPPPPPPPVLFSPTGEVTPFEARFDGFGAAWTVTVDAFGETEVARAE
ncbi:type II secretion system protein H [Parvularcula dongshanensis]|uniref:Type II secretion system protein H n=1 Tax=Parvularcula dongshanensis TaxID=1173995 RepID=A0A840I012_9PROT|nr:type II secretion system protein H [Parvularcula dongshanensis]